MTSVDTSIDKLVRFVWLFYNQTVFQKIESSFFLQVVIDAKNV